MAVGYRDKAVRLELWFGGRGMSKMTCKRVLFFDSNLTRDWFIICVINSVQCFEFANCYMPQLKVVVDSMTVVLHTTVS